MATENRNDVKGFIPVTTIGSVGSRRFINYNNITDIGIRNGNTHIYYDQENYTAVRETVKEVMELIYNNQNLI